MVKGKFKIGSYQFKWEFQYLPSRISKIKHESIKLHFGPGPNWEKPDSQWLSIDVDPKRGDIVLNFNEFDKIPLMDNSVSCIYGSHIFEHISIFLAPKVFKECFRVLKPGGYFRLVLPDVKKSIEEYLNGNYKFPVFQMRINFLKKRLGYEHITLFEALKGDFISPSGQPDLFGETGLAHQNAWDYETIVCELVRVGFSAEKINKMSYQKTNCSDFFFEGTYPSEANESYRSIYVEAKK